MAVARTGNTGVLTTPGDLMTVDLVGGLQRIAVGAEGKVLTANPSNPSGLDWADPRQPVFLGGADMTLLDAGKYYEVQATSGGVPKVALNSDSEMTSGVAGFLRRITWRTTSGFPGSTVFKVWKDGAVVYTLTIPSGSGSFLIPVALPISTGSFVAVEYDAGAAPGRSTVQVSAGGGF